MSIFGAIKRLFHLGKPDRPRKWSIENDGFIRCVFRFDREEGIDRGVFMNITTGIMIVETGDRTGVLTLVNMTARNSGLFKIDEGTDGMKYPNQIWNMSDRME